MSLFTYRRQNQLRQNPARRQVRPELEGMERRQLLSGATISGTTYQDLAGNGAFSDVSRLPGVTVNLYQKGSTVVFEHVASDKNGNFSFSNLTPGSYSVQQVVPKSFLPTGALYGYSTTLKSGQSATGKDFEDFQLSPLPKLSNLSYVVTTPSGHSKTVSTLNGNVQEGDTVTAKFKLSTPAALTLVAYTAPNDNFDTTNLQEQKIFSKATATGSGSGIGHGHRPPTGTNRIDQGGSARWAIDHLDTNSNVLYHSQDRFIDGQNGGNQADALSVSQGPSSTTSGNNSLSTGSTRAAWSTRTRRPGYRSGPHEH